MRTPFLYLMFAVFIALVNPGSGIFAQGKKISQFERAGLCDLLIDKQGVYHAVFQESSDDSRPVYIYYSFSTNKGASWSTPVNLSNDNTGNGCGYPRIIQDGKGIIYAIWKRYGKPSAGKTLTSVLSDGPGGIELGTLFYKVLNGGAWSNAIQLNEMEATQNSWFATISPGGQLCVFWTQLSPDAIKGNWNYYTYCDFLRMVVINGSSHSAFNNLNSPPQGSNLPTDGAWNLNGYIGRSNEAHLVYEDKTDEVQSIKYFNGRAQVVAYSFPKFSTHNTFNDPPRLLVDEKGSDHLVFLPAAETVESAQVWDKNLITGETKIIAQLQERNVSIRGFQAYQGPGGAMAVVIEAGRPSGNVEAYGAFYEGGAWKNVGLTNNAAREKFFYKEFVPIGNRTTYLSTLTRYNSGFTRVAYDANGRKCMLMTISADWSTGGYNTSSPSILFSPID